MLASWCHVQQPSKIGWGQTSSPQSHTQHQQQLVFWHSNPLCGMQQLERAVVACASVKQPLRLHAGAYEMHPPASAVSRLVPAVNEASCQEARPTAGKLRHVTSSGIMLSSKALLACGHKQTPAVHDAGRLIVSRDHRQQVQQGHHQSQAGAVNLSISQHSVSDTAMQAPPPGQGQQGATPAKQRQQDRKHRPWKQQQQTVTPFSVLLSEHQRVHMQQQPQPPDAALSAEDGHRLDRKLTAVLTGSCSSWQHVADVLLAADSAGRLNAVHVAAALATLARLAAADKASSSSSSDNLPAGVTIRSHIQQQLTFIVPVSRQQAHQLKIVQRAATAALAAGFRSCWQTGARQSHHSPASNYTQLTAANSFSHLDDQHMDLGMDNVDDDSSFHAATGNAADDDNSEKQYQQLLDHLCAAVSNWWPAMSFATVTSCCWSLASLGQPLLQPLLPEVGQTLRTMAQQLQEVSSSSSGSADSDRDVVTLMRQLVVMLWSLAKMSVEPHELEEDSSTYQLSSTQQQLYTVVTSAAGPCAPSVLSCVVSAMDPHLNTLTSQGLVMVWWALATWSNTDTSGLQPPAAAAALLSATCSAVTQQTMTPRGLAVVIWAVARLQVTPDATWLAAWLAALHTSVAAASTHDCAMSVWGLARLGVRPPGEWLTAVCWRAVGQTEQLAAQELPMMLWGLARLRFRPPLQVAQQLLGRGLTLAAGGELSPQGIALTLWAAATLGLKPRAYWVEGMLAAAAEYLPLFRAVDCSALLVALVRLQHIPHQVWMDLWWQETADKLAAADGQQLVLLLWCSVQLGQAPPAAWWAEWQRCSAAAMCAGGVSAQGYGLIWHALLQLEVAPGSSWFSSYWEASVESHVLSQLDPLAAERTLAGLAAVTRLAADHSRSSSSSVGVIRPPGSWLQQFVIAAQHQLYHANVVNICVMLQAAGQLQILLPRSWLYVAMERLKVLLQAEGVVEYEAVSSTNCTSNRLSAAGHRFHMQYNLTARLRRRWLAVRLKQALEGLRAQQMLARAAARQQQHLEQRSSPQVAVGALDVLATWPWLSAAVMRIWPNRVSAATALRGISDNTSEVCDDHGVDPS